MSRPAAGVPAGSFTGPVVLFANSEAMGGMEQHVLFLAAGLVERGVPTTLVCSPSPAVAPLREGAIACGAAVITPTERRGLGGARRRFHELADAFRGAAGGVLHVHSTGFHGGDLVMLAGRRAGLAAVVRTEHVPPQPPLGLRHRLHVRGRDRLLVSKVICVSEGNRREHVEVLGRDPDQLVVIPNGIVVEEFTAPGGADLREELRLDPATRLVGVVGRLAEERKGGAEFLRMAAAVAPAHPDAHFVVAGDGPLRAGLEALAGELGLAGRVSFLGSRPDVARVVGALDVFVMPSLWEAGPLTLLEAMAAGRAVVTTAVGVAPDVIDDGRNGLLVAPGDIAALAEALVRLLADRALAARLGAAAAAEAQRSFSVSRMVDRTIELYRSVVEVS